LAQTGREQQAPPFSQTTVRLRLVSLEPLAAPLAATLAASKQVVGLASNSSNLGGIERFRGAPGHKEAVNVVVGVVGVGIVGVVRVGVDIFLLVFFLFR
jgi:hypothetical protein